ncbi:uncharacterized protein LOC124353762 [Homalodisca vitripennis]|uniref:uncharacterized protein LOC124353762 n=1 Tax=Homalodisca vitripennis TaxID=197043 RepID=UPI001EEA75DE|nr:uncharacterized protein LOC124353762 [Homalodisca vitripennis]
MLECKVQLQFTFHLVQRPNSNAVTDLTPEIWNQHPSEEIQNHRRRRSSNRTLYIVSTSETPGLQTNVIKMKWSFHCLNRLVGLRLGYGYLEVSTREVASLLQLPALETRRFYHDAIFLFRLVNSTVDCPELLERICFRVPAGTRSQYLFARSSVSSSYLANSTMRRIQLHGNLLPNHMDFFASSFLTFKRNLKTFINLQHT